MKAPKFTDTHRGRYHSAEASREPGYLARRFKAFKRLEERRSRASATVTQIKRKFA
jgi:hypothetical protein